MLKFIDTPCVGICSTVYGDEICRGCKREYQEVIQWNGFKPEARQAVYQRLDHLIATVMQEFVLALDEKRFTKALDKVDVRMAPYTNKLTQLFFLLKTLRPHNLPVEKLGITLKNPDDNLSLQTLFNQIDDRIYQVANESNKEVAYETESNLSK